MASLSQKKCLLVLFELLLSLFQAYSTSSIHCSDNLCFQYRARTRICSSKLLSTTFEESPKTGLLSFTLEELSNILGGTGRAAAVWDCIRQGIDPNIYHSNVEDTSDEAILKSWMEAAVGTTQMDNSYVVKSPSYDEMSRLGFKVRDQLQNIMTRYSHSIDYNGNQPYTGSVLSIDSCIATISQLKVSSDGTTKLLLKMAKDGLEVESVIIPWKEKGFSTLCVS